MNNAPSFPGGNRALGEPSVAPRHTQAYQFGIKIRPEGLFFCQIGEGRVDIVARLCIVVDWCIDHPEYTAKIKVIPKKDYPVLMPCEF